MKTILYMKRMEKIGTHLEQDILKHVPQINIERHHSLEQLSQLLRQPLNKVSVVILIIASKEELTQISLMNPLFENSRIILILPDREKRTLSSCLELKPSFISFIDSDLKDVVSVLGQIHKKAKEKRQNG